MLLALSAIIKSVILIGAANMAPVGLKLLLSNRYSAPIDGGLAWRDGRRLLGPSKTWRGLVIGVLFPACLSPLIGLSWVAGMSAGAAAMAGDCFSSFVKRRLGFESSERALGLDQIPEALLPAVFMRAYVQLSVIEVGAIVLIFSVGALALSRIFFRLGLRERPY
jgi:CDP-2,3-bis-(O-geranylgeranyl)-sn-glycerol synthase